MFLWHIITAAETDCRHPYFENGWEINISPRCTVNGSIISAITSMLFKNPRWEHIAGHNGRTVCLILFHFRICLTLCLSLIFFLVLGWRGSNSESFFKETLVSSGKCRISPWNKKLFQTGQNKNSRSFVAKAFIYLYTLKSFQIISLTLGYL